MTVNFSGHFSGGGKGILTFRADSGSLTSSFFGECRFAASVTMTYSYLPRFFCGHLAYLKMKPALIRRPIDDLAGDQSGATAIEYVLLLALIALVGVAAAGQIADSYNGVDNIVVNRLGAAESNVTSID